MTRARDAAGKFVPQKVTVKSGDGLSNFAAALGGGADNLHAQSTYTYNFITRNRNQLEAMYRTSWIVGQAVDVVADDMTQAGIQIKSQMPPDDSEILHGTFEDLQIWQAICSTVKWSRLYGGALALILIDGQDFETELNVETVGRGQFKGLLPLDRWQVRPETTNLVSAYGPDMGMPMFYNVTQDSITPNLGRIHYSRIIRLDAIQLPHYQRISEQLWGESVIERLYDRLIAFDSTTVGAAQLVYKAYLRTWKIEGLRNLIAQGGPMMTAVTAQIDFTRRYQSNEGLTLLDSKDEFETHSYSFAGLDNVLMQFGQQLSGALEIPLVRLFGQSPSGLNSSGESDLRTYYDGIRKRQGSQLRGPIRKLLEIASRSVLGKELPPGFRFEFTSLWQLTEEQKANIAKTDSDSIGGVFDRGLISEEIALNELRQSNAITGRFSNISDQFIAKADVEPPSGETALDPNAEPAKEAEEREDA